MAIAEVGGGSQRATKLGNQATSPTQAFPANVTSGSLLIVAGCAFLSGGVTVSSVTDTRSTSYSVLSAVPFTNGRLFIAYGIAPSGGANTVTVNFSGNAQNSFSIDEFSGVNATPLDVNGGQSTGTGTSASDALTTITANDLLIGVAAYDAADVTFVAGASYTLIGKEASNLHQDHLAEFRLVTTAQSYTVDATLGASVPWGMYTAAFKEAGSAFIAEDDSFKIPVGSPIDPIVSVWG